MYTKTFYKGLAAAVVVIGAASYNFGHVSAQSITSEDLAPTVTAAQVTDTPDTCVDGSDRANLTYHWDEKGTVSVSTKDGKLLCADETLYLSSYTLPDSYDNSGIFDDSSVPQQLFDSSSVVLHKGTTGDATLNIDVPDACTTYQLDLYYAPEITEVGYHGHEGQLVYGRIYLTTQEDCSCNTAPAPGQGGDTEETVPPVVAPVTPAETPAPIVAAANAPVAVPQPIAAAPVKATTAVELPDTGSNQNLLAVVISLLASGMATLVAPIAVGRKNA